MNGEHDNPQPPSQSNAQNQEMHMMKSIAETLKSLPEKRKKETKLQATLKRLKPSIEEAIKKNYTVKEIYDIFLEKGVKEIKESKLRAFVTQIRNEQKQREKEAEQAKKAAAVALKKQGNS